MIINGGCNINKNSFIGSASILKENISIKEQSFIKWDQSLKMKVNIIAEAGVNHNGSLNKAKKMALEAKKAGADFVKFQIFDYNEIALKILKNKLSKNNTRNSSENQYEMLRKLSF